MRLDSRAIAGQSIFRQCISSQRARFAFAPMEPSLELPLLGLAQSADAIFPLVVSAHVAEATEARCGIPDVALPPMPGPGEQYRFHFDMTKCIGCKCCVVACNEQNGNPAGILWRRVGEIEGGSYPDTRRHYLSMGCNHCLEPTCLTGCPVDAYSKDGVTGIVRHSADICIGCQYCTWNCSYGVPQYNPERGVVGKCDMCYGRLTRGQLPVVLPPVRKMPSASKPRAWKTGAGNIESRQTRRECRRR